MLGLPMLYLKGMATMMFQLAGFCCNVLSSGFFFRVLGFTGFRVILVLEYPTFKLFGIL